MSKSKSESKEKGAFLLIYLNGFEVREHFATEEARNDRLLKVIEWGFTVTYPVHQGHR